MRKRREKNNLLVLVDNGEEKKYFTTFNRASLYLGVNVGTVQWAIKNNTKVFDEITVKVIDGSNIKYKYIDN